MNFMQRIYVYHLLMTMLMKTYTNILFYFNRLRLMAFFHFLSTFSVIFIHLFFPFHQFKLRNTNIFATQKREQK